MATKRERMRQPLWDSDARLLARQRAEPDEQRVFRHLPSSSPSKRRMDTRDIDGAWRAFWDDILVRHNGKLTPAMRRQRRYAEQRKRVKDQRQDDKEAKLALRHWKDIEQHERVEKRKEIALLKQQAKKDEAVRLERRSHTKMLRAKNKLLWHEELWLARYGY